MSVTGKTNRKIIILYIKGINVNIGKYTFDTDNETYIVGILNVTPDSFSDGGNFNSLDKALLHAENMIKDGAAIIDIGGESTRPNHIKISGEEEIDRVCPIIEAIRDRFDIPISLDTYKSDVAEAGLKSGAHLINDIWGLKWDNTMAGVIAKYNGACCIMHNRRDTNYIDFVEDVLADLQESIDMAKTAGMDMNQVMTDPGVGFAKDLDMNLSIMKHVGRLKELGYPVLLGTSRKSMIGLTLDLPSDEREEGTLSTSVMGLMSGCAFFRVHDVRANYRALKMTKAIMNAK